MTIDELAQYIEARGYKIQRDGNAILAGRWLDLRSLTTLPDGVTLSAGGWLDLSRLTTLPEGVTLSAGGALYLNSLTTLPEGVTLSAGGSLDLRSLTTLPEGVTLSAGGSLYLRNLTEGQTYKGKRVRIRTIDWVCTRLIRSRSVGDATLFTAQYFRGDLDNDPRCYVAQSGDTYAHGDTPEKALRDLRFKLAQRDLDPSELVEQIKRRGVVTFNDYRLLTGACEAGLSEGLRARGLAGVEELPLKTALELCGGAYGGDTFRRLMGVAQ